MGAGEIGVRPGERIRRPGVARALAAIAADGRRGFYEGEFGEALLALGAGEFTADDLSRRQADWVEALGVDAFDQRLWTLPPNSQGYVLLRAAAVASGLTPPNLDDPEWAHQLIECERLAAADRDMVWHERSDPDGLIASAALDGMRAQVTGRRRGVPGPAQVRGGTVSLCVVDRERMSVSMLQSNFFGWGALLFLPGLGIPLHNRGASFSLVPGHPAEYGPGRRPPHTLAPALVTANDGSLRTALATRGGDTQPQVLLQLLARLAGGSSPGAAMAAGRWANAGELVRVEGHAPEHWVEGLSARGHRIARAGAFSPDFGQAQLIVRNGGHLVGASDPRNLGWVAAAL